MTHLPLNLGDYTTASGPVTITRIGKHGKWAFGREFPLTKWHVETGEHSCNERFDITGRVEVDNGRVEPDRPDPNWVFSADAAPKAPLECWMIRRSIGNLFRSERSSNPSAVRMIEAGPIEAELARVTAERDEAVAVLHVQQRAWDNMASSLARGGGITFAKNELESAVMSGRAFLAKIGAKPAEARNSQSDISTSHDALLALEMLKERQTGDSSGGSWSRGWDAGLDAAIKVVANLTEAKP